MFVDGLRERNGYAPETVYTLIIYRRGREGGEKEVIES